MKYNDKQSEQRVLEKTAELLSNRGIRGWNMDQLAAETGLAKNTLYRIIGSKEELIERVTLNQCRSVHLRIVNVINRETSYMKTLEIIVDEYPEHMSLYTNFFREVFLEYPRLEKTVRGYSDELKVRIIQFLERGIDEGYLRADLKAESVFEILQAISLFYIKAGAKDTELATKVREGFHCLLYGVVPRVS